jgi:hypothetical protein
MSKKSILEEARDLHNHICILFDHDLVRVIGYHEDEIDCYYKVCDANGKIWCATAVGYCVSLKDIYPRYDILDDSFNRNHCPRTKVFEVTIATPEENAAMYGPGGTWDQQFGSPVDKSEQG